MEILKKLRKQQGLNKTQMAKKLGIAKSYYTMLENGQREISKSLAIRIHDEFGIPLETLLLPNQVHRPETKEASANG